MPVTNTEKCHCGLPLHYTDAQVKSQVDDIIKRFGPYIDITNSETGKTYRVQRHYIALHGIKGADLSTLGFPEVKK